MLGVHTHLVKNVVFLRTLVNIVVPVVELPLNAVAFIFIRLLVVAPAKVDAVLAAEEVIVIVYVNLLDTALRRRCAVNLKPLVAVRTRVVKINVVPFVGVVVLASFLNIVSVNDMSADSVSRAEVVKQF